MKHEAHFIGQAGEYLVAAELTALGHVVMTSPPKVKYDLVVDVDDTLLKIQVKTIAGPRVNARTGRSVYEFSMRKERKSGSFYADTDIDGFALVAFDRREIAFIPLGEAASSISFKAPEHAYGSAKSSKRMKDKQYSFGSFVKKVMRKKATNV